MLEEGDRAPDFELVGVEEGEVRTFSLAEAADEGRVVLAFYPADFSPDCAEEMCSLRDVDLLTLYDDLTLYGLSTDSVYSHRAFAEEYRLQFPLLVDSLGDVAESYGVLHEEIEGHRRLAKRSLFVVDADRRVRYAWATDDPARLPDVDRVREVLERV